MKRFFYLSAGLLLLTLTAAIAFHIGSTIARADGVAESGIVIVGVPGQDFVVDEFGQVWRFGYDSAVPYEECWAPVSLNAIPPGLTPAELKLVSGNIAVTKQNEVWTRDIAGGLLGEWHNCGQWPGGTIPTEQRTLGGVKDSYSKDD